MYKKFVINKKKIGIRNYVRIKVTGIANLKCSASD